MEADRLVQGEATKADSLDDLMTGADLVLSALGITRQKDGLTYWNVDYQANVNLLRAAERANVKHFGYIYVLAAEKMKMVALVQAKQAFVEELQASPIRHSVIAPSGYFSNMEDFLDMARSGRVWLFGDGTFRLNPIDGRDLAKATAQAIEDVLKDLKLEQVGKGKSDGVWRWLQTSGDIRFEFLTPYSEGTEEIQILPKLGISVRGLPFLDYLINDAILVPFLYRHGILVRVPRPERYAIHKLMVADALTDTVEMEKGLAQAEVLIEALAEDRPVDLAQAVGIAENGKPLWGRHLSATLEKRQRLAWLLSPENLSGY